MIFHSGVTTAVDGGSAGALTFPGLRQFRFFYICHIHVLFMSSFIFSGIMLLRGATARLFSL